MSLDTGALRTRAEARRAEAERAGELPGSGDGWTGAAIAVRSILLISTPLLLRLAPDNLAPIYIDFRHHAFQWDQPMSSFPAMPAAVDVETEPAPVGSPPLFDLPGQNLDNLLWLMGLHSFSGEAASWLRPGDRYRLSRWPNFTELAHDMTQMRMVSILANGAFTADELATATSTNPLEARRLINALSLMGILSVIDAATVAASAAPAVAPVAPAAQAGDDATSSSLFRRLRDRLGL